MDPKFMTALAAARGSKNPMIIKKFIAAIKANYLAVDMLTSFDAREKCWHEHNLYSNALKTLET